MAQAASRTWSEPAVLRRPWRTWLPAGFVLLGVALRFRQYAARRSLWNDEAALALNVVNRGYGELVEPLDIDQGAPLGFLWGQRTAVSLLGNNEFALRLIPLLGGVAALVLVAAVARRVLSPLAASAAVLLASVLGPLVYYSAEAKQYSTDVAVTMLLLYATLRLLDGRMSMMRAVGWGGLGCACMLLSHPAVLVMAACSLVAGAVVVAQRRTRALGVLALGVAVWAGGLVVLYVVSLRDLAANESLEAYWQEGFAPRPLRVGTSVSWAADVVSGLVPNPIELSVPALVLALAIAGAGALLFRRPAAGLIVLAVAAAALAASLVGVYPLKARLALYLVPVVLLALAAALDVARGRRMAAVLVRVVVAAGLVAIATRPVSEAADAVASPYTVTELRSVLVRMEAAMEPTDAVYAHWTAVVLYNYYAPVLDLPDLAGYFAFHQDTTCAATNPVVPLQTHPRVWVLFAYPPGFDPADDAETALTQLDRLGARIDERTAPGTARAVLYDTALRSQPPPPGRTPRPGDCFNVMRNQA